jgi:hypothetical protein
MYKEPLDADWVFVIHDFLSTGECRALIETGESLGFSAAPIGEVAVLKEYRDSDRVVFDNAMPRSCSSGLAPAFPSTSITRK